MRITPDSLNGFASLSAYARHIVREVKLVGHEMYIYTRKDIELIDTLLAQDKPSRHVDDPFFWAWYNARRTFSRLAWDGFNATIFAQRGNKPTETQLAKRGVVFGRMDSKTCAEVDRLYHSIPVQNYDVDDVRPGYAFDPNHNAGYGEERNRTNDIRKPSAALLEALTKWVGSAASELEAAMGHPFRIILVRLFSLKGATKNGPDHWHLDEWPTGIKKLQIYPWPTSLELGSTEFRLKDSSGTVHVEGEPGIWGLFENSTAFHRSRPPAEATRPTIELSITPAVQNDTRCFDAGMNATYPWFPPEFSPAEGEEPDQYVQCMATAFYVRALLLALHGQEFMRGSMPSHVAPGTGKFANSLPRRTVVALSRMKRLLRYGL